MATVKQHASTINEAAFAKASERGRRLLARGPLATSARYEAGRIHVELNNGCAFEFPVAHAEGLAGAKALELRYIEVSASGLGWHWPKLDANLYVPALVTGILSNKQRMTQIGALGAARPPSQKQRLLRPTASLAVGRVSHRLRN